MGKIADTVFTCSYISVIMFGILGNILVIISIARQKQLLTKNYYFAVLHLAFCDLGALIMKVVVVVFLELSVVRYRGIDIFCLVSSLHGPFYISGILIMLLVSILRYRATVHPLQPAISRAKLIKVCHVVYVVGLIIGLGLTLSLCFNLKLNFLNNVMSYLGFDLFFYLVPMIFMIVCYCKIGLALVKQNKQIKRMGSAAVRNRHNRDRRIFLVCLCTVLFFAVGRLLISVSRIWSIADKYSSLSKHRWLDRTGRVLLVAGSYSANPLIYGILDKRMFKFVKLCRKKRQTPV